MNLLSLPDNEDVKRSSTLSQGSNGGAVVIKKDYLSEKFNKQVFMLPYDAEVLYNCILSFLVYMD